MTTTMTTKLNICCLLASAGDPLEVASKARWLERATRTKTASGTRTS